MRTGEPVNVHPHTNIRCTYTKTAKWKVTIETRVHCKEYGEEGGSVQLLTHKVRTVFGYDVSNFKGGESLLNSVTPALHPPMLPLLELT